MRYKDLIERKLESIHNLTLGLDSLISGAAPVQQIREYIQRIKDLVEEVNSLLQKEA